jgi:predicted O-methyltransferase YrrM
MAGVSYDLDAMRSLLASLAAEHGGELAELPPYEEAKRLGYGPGFTRLDATLLYLVLRDLRPRRVIEVGSGLSTWYAVQALERNRADGVPAKITCIDPYSGDRVRGLPGVEVLRREVQDVAPEYFEALGAGDVLFIDSTHVVRIDGDVPHLYLEVLPRLRPGVVVHSHDIHFPYNVPHPAEEYVFGAKWPMLWTEAMLLQAFLALNDEFELLLAPPLLRHHDEAFLEATMPGYRPVVPHDYDTHFGSVWYRRKLG